MEQSIIEKYASLPVSEIVGTVNDTLADVSRLVITAPPGAGKSTLLPLTMLQNIPHGKIVMLEPRRIAARQVAARMADMLGETPGQTVGYRVRFDSRVSAQTRIEVVTEGVFERMIIDDSTLEGVAMVIFDEYHERSMSLDLSMALVLEAQKVIRPDLKVVVMSATIDATELCSRIDALHLHCPGRLFDVEKIHLGDFEIRDIVDVVCRAVAKAYRDNDGDILVFLPGQSEIMCCAARLEGAFEDAEIQPLYGMLDAAGQRRVLSATPHGRRIVLATSIAETSLTIPGIRVVVDAGLCRKPVYDPRRGISCLATVPVSLDMADQRAGRAGRMENGICYRLWSRATESRMDITRTPEILTADLSPMVLAVSAWGENNPLALPWVSEPPVGHIEHAKRLLQELNAVDHDGKITPLGKTIAKFPCHPRIARMLIHAGDKASLACDIAALLDEKDPFNNEHAADICTRLAVMHGNPKTGRSARLADISAQYRRMVNIPKEQTSGFTPEDVGQLIARAFPERVAMRTADGRFRVATGEYVLIGDDDLLSRCDYLAIADMDKRIFLAAPMSAADVCAMGTWVDRVEWDSRNGRAVARKELRVGALTVAVAQPDSDMRNKVTDAICQAAVKNGLSMFNISADVQRLQMRLATVADWHPELSLPNVGTEALMNTAAQWLPLFIGNATTAQELKKIDMCAVIWGILDYETQQTVDKIAPSHLRLPGGRNVRIDYRRGAEAPIVSARLQDCFGLTETPRLDNGRCPVLMELLSPGFKPVQLTQDMAGFWSKTYFEVRKELKRRYPKHRWPDNPMQS